MSIARNVGFGIAFGLFSKAILLPHWALEAVLVAWSFAFFSLLFDARVYRYYKANCERIGEKPTSLFFIVADTLTNAAVIFATAFAVKGIRAILT